MILVCSSCMYRYNLCLCDFSVCFRLNLMHVRFNLFLKVKLELVEIVGKKKESALHPKGLLTIYFIYFYFLCL